MSRYLVFILFVLEIAFAQETPKKFIAVMGGGGEPKGDNTIFDRSITELGNYLEKNPEWVSTVSFNGGHSKTEEISFPDLTFDIATKNKLLKSAKWLFDDLITNKIREMAHYNMGKELKNQRVEKIIKEINKTGDWL
jgi:hypothetical protein